MAWPPAATGVQTNGFGYEGSLPTTLGWGTDDLYSGVIVVNLRSREVTEPIRIENGKGLTSMLVMLKDGNEIEVTVIDDRSITFPLSGKPVTILDPLPNGAGASSTTYLVLNNNYQGARKQPGERTLLAQKFILFASSDIS